MAETALTVRDVSETEVDLGALIENVDTANENSAANPNGDVMFFIWNNGATGQAVVTFTAQNSPKTIAGHGPLTKANLAVTLETGEKKLIGPFNAQMWNDGSDNVLMVHSGTGEADLDILAFRAVKS